MTDSQSSTQTRCDSCMRPATRHDSPDGDASWNDPRGAHDCEACGSVICTTCALANQIGSSHNPGWQCPECTGENLQQV